jgi:HK97 family phage portal protein
MRRTAGRTFYDYKDGAVTKTYESGEIIDVSFLLKSDGVGHYSPTERLKNALGLALAMEDYASRFFLNGGVPPLAMQGPAGSPAAITRASGDIQAAVQEAHKKSKNVLYLPTGHELKPIGFDPDKGQLVEARRFQVEEVARIYDIPPVFLQDLTNGTFSNTEQQDLHFVKHTLTQWVEQIEQELNAKLFSRRNRQNFVEFNLDGLLRGDFKTRMEGYAQGVQNAILTPDEVRAMENRPAKGGKADDLFIQGATMPVESAGQQIQPPADPAPTDNQPQGGPDEPA